MISGTLLTTIQPLPFSFTKIADSARFYKINVPQYQHLFWPLLLLVQSIYKLQSGRNVTLPQFNVWCVLTMMWHGYGKMALMWINASDINQTYKKHYECTMYWSSSQWNGVFWAKDNAPLKWETGTQFSTLWCGQE